MFRTPSAMEGLMRVQSSIRRAKPANKPHGCKMAFQDYGAYIELQSSNESSEFD